MNLRLVLMLVSDALLAVVALLVAVTMRYGVEGLRQATSHEACYIVILVFVGFSLFSSYLMEIYSVRRGSCRWEIGLKSLQCGCVNFIFLAFAYYFHPYELLGQGVLFLSISFFCVFQTVWHLISRSGKEQPAFSKRVLILGTEELSKVLADLISQKSMFTLVGVLNLGGQSTVTYSLPSQRNRAVDFQEDLLTIVRKENVDIIVVALPERRGVLPLQEIMQCKLNGIEIFDSATFYEILQGKLMLERMTLNNVISSGFGSTRVIGMLKRCVDLIISAAILITFLPFFPIFVLAVKLDSSGSIFFKIIKVGGNEKPFFLYKFRITFVHGEPKAHASSAVECDGLTSLGRFLRRSGLEQLPQFYNVLIGDMSLVGPRPENPEFVDMLKKDVSYYSKRHTIKPGITGLAQVKHPDGSGKEDAVEKLGYDLYYVKNLSPSLDSQIVLETVKVALFGRRRR